MRTKCCLVLVCRYWRQVSTPLFYHHIVIRSPARADRILQVLHSRSYVRDRGDSPKTRLRISEYGQFTRHVEIFTHARGAKNLHFLQIIFRIFQYCPNVRTLSGTWNHQLPSEFLESITKMYGGSLQGLYWSERAEMEDASIVGPKFFASFQALRILDLRNLEGGDPESEPTLSEDRPTLPCVQDLVLSTQPRCLLAAVGVSLPALRNLTLKTPDATSSMPERLMTAFLHMHGENLISIDLKSPSSESEFEPPRAAYHPDQTIGPEIFLQPGKCPHLHTLTFPSSSPELEVQVHASLSRIGIRGVRSDRLYPDKASTVQAHLKSFTRSTYPNLEIVRTVGFLVDAEGDALIKDIFIWWAERFENDGIDFQDGEGVLWVYDTELEEYWRGAAESEGEVAINPWLVSAMKS